MNQLQKIIFGTCLIITSLSADANGFFGRSARNTFGDQRVAELLDAASAADVTTAKSLIAKGVNINAFGEGGLTPLLWLESKGDIRGMKLLLELGADPNGHTLLEPGEIGSGPPLWMAADEGKKEIVQLLLDYRADPNLAIGGSSPLMMAVGSAHLDCAELLLKHGADINYSNGSPFSPTVFDMGIIILRYDIILWVLNHGYTHGLEKARSEIVREHRKPRPGQEQMKRQALEMIDGLIAQQSKE